MCINIDKVQLVFLSHKARTTEEVRESIFLNTLPNAWLDLTNQITAPNIYLNKKQHEFVKPILNLYPKEYVITSDSVERLSNCFILCIYSIYVCHFDYCVRKVSGGFV